MGSSDSRPPPPPPLPLLFSQVGDLSPPSPPPPSQAISTHTEINPIIAPVNNFNPTNTNIINSMTYDPALSDDQKILLNALFTSLATSSAALVLGESPLYFGSLGALIAGGKKVALSKSFTGVDPGVGFTVSTDVLAIAGGTLASGASGRSILSSALILGTGSYLGDLL